MPDPLSIISVAALALHTTRKTKEFINSIVDAPRAVANVTSELAALQVPLANLNNLLVQTRLSNNLVKNDLFPQLDRPLTSCQETLEEIESAIKPYVKLSSNGRINKWRSFTWSFKEKDIEKFRRELLQRKETLDIAISCANLIVSHHSSDDVRRANKKLSGIEMHLGIDSYSVVDSEFAGSDTPMFHSRTRVKNWVSETQAVIEEPFVLPDNNITAGHDHQINRDDLPRPLPVELPSLPTLGLQDGTPGTWNIREFWAGNSSTTPGKNPALKQSDHEVKLVGKRSPEPRNGILDALSNFMSPSAKNGTFTESLGPSKQHEGRLTKPLRKTIVSKAALQHLGIDYKEDEHSTTVLVDKDLESWVIAKARHLSLELCELSSPLPSKLDTDMPAAGSDRRKWWAGKDLGPLHSEIQSGQMRDTMEIRRPASPKNVPRVTNALVHVRTRQPLHPRNKRGEPNEMWRSNALEFDRGEVIAVDQDVWSAAARTAWIPGTIEDRSGRFPKHFVHPGR